MRLLLLLLGLLISREAATQQPHFNTYTIPGLGPNLMVQEIYQDKEGFLWFGTGSGLYRFNGRKYQHISSPDTIEQPSVTAIYMDDQKVLWVGFKSGALAQVRQNMMTFLEIEEGHPASAITGILQDERGRIWISTYGEGLYYFGENNRFYNFGEDDGLSNNSVYAIANVKGGEVWAATDNGISIASVEGDEKKVHKIGRARGLPDDIVRCLTIDLEGNVWAGMYDRGFCKINASARKVEMPAGVQSWQNGPVNSIVVFGDAVWTGTNGNGIYAYNLQHKSLNQLTRTAGEKVYSMAIDDEGNTWAGTNTSGILMANTRFGFIGKTGEKSLQNIHSVLADSLGRLWFSNMEGLWVYDLRGEQPHAQKVPLPLEKNSQIISLYATRFGCLWIGTFGQGLYRLDTATGKVLHYTEKDGLANNNILSITGSGDNIWLATLGGASRAIVTGRKFNDPIHFESFTGQSDLGINYIYQAYIDSRGRVWFATDGRGITMYNNGSFTNFNTENGLTNRVVYSVTEDKQGIIWCSTADGNLFWFDDMKFNLLQDADLPTPATALTTAGNGSIVVVHEEGIALLDPSAKKLHKYGSNAGIGKIDPDLNSFTNDCCGNVWLGTKNGLVIYNPFQREVRKQPLTRITTMQVLLEPQLLEDDKRLPHHRNHITYQFNGLWYQNPGTVSFRYKLDGYSDSWIVTQDEVVTFPSLPPGEYKFHVIAGIDGDFSADADAVHSFRIGRPYWATWWFYAILLVVAAAIVYAVMKLRERQLRHDEDMKKEQIRFRFETLRSQVNPHFLFNSFNTLISVIEDDKDVAVEYVEQLSNFFRNILEYRDRELITVKEELELLDTYYFLQQKRYGSNFILEVNIDENQQKKQIPPLTLQMLVENAVKHNIISRSKNLVVNIFTTGNKLVVVNNLQKKLTVEDSTGFGLETIKNRYRLLGKEEPLIIETEAEYKVILPLLSN